MFIVHSFRFDRMKTYTLFLIHAWTIAIVSSQNKIVHDHIKTEKPTPVVIWHGMGDNCCHSFSMGRIKQLLEDHIKGNKLCIRGPTKFSNTKI